MLRCSLTMAIVFSGTAAVTTAAAQTEQMAALVKLGRPFLKGTR